MTAPEALMVTLRFRLLYKHVLTRVMLLTGQDARESAGFLLAKLPSTVTSSMLLPTYYLRKAA